MRETTGYSRSTVGLIFNDDCRRSEYTVTRWYRSFGDLLVIGSWTLCAAVIVTSGTLEVVPFRLLLVVPVVLFAPGYALISALFPRRRDDADAGPISLDGLERAVLSVVVSIGLVPLVAFVVNYTPYGLTMRPIFLVLTGLTVALGLVAFARRLRLPAERRFGVAPLGSLRRLTTAYTGVGDGTDTRPLSPTTGAQQLLNVLLVVSLLVLAASVGYALVTPPGDDEGFTEAYLLTKSGGEFTSEHLPKQYTAGQPQTLYVALGNHEGETTQYSVVATLDGNPIDQFSTSVPRGETKRVERRITPQRQGDSLRLQFLVYKGDAPSNPTADNAYQVVQLWISVD